MLMESISLRCISCSGLKNRLSGLPDIIEKFGVVGEWLDATEAFG